MGTLLLSPPIVQVGAAAADGTGPGSPSLPCAYMPACTLRRDFSLTCNSTLQTSAESWMARGTCHCMQL